MMLEPKKIYPNYNNEIKWLGIIEYKLIVVLGIYAVFVWIIVKLITQNIFIALYITIILTIPVLVVFYSNIGKESMYNVLKTIIRFVLSKKRYVYRFENKMYKTDFFSF